MPTEHLEVPEWRDAIQVPDIKGRDVSPFFSKARTLSEFHRQHPPASGLRLYISGPMRNIPRFNFPMFDACRDYLRSLGHQAVSPADHDRAVDPKCEERPGFLAGTDIDVDSPCDFNELMVWDLEQVIHADGIVLLPGWEHSTGAAYELSAARGTGKRVFYYHPTAVTTRDLPPSYDGRLIEETKPTIIGISGYAQAGKDTIGSVLTESAGFLRVAFADALRDVLAALNPWVTVTAGSPSPLPLSVQHVVSRYGWEWAKAHTDVRAYLQRLGTEAGREILGDDIWVRTAMAKVNGGKYVFTDVRFPNEARAIIDKGGQVWRVTRPGTAPVNAHPSETALDDWPFDRTILNDGSLEDLTYTVLGEVSASVE